MRRLLPMLVSCAALIVPAPGWGQPEPTSQPTEATSQPSEATSQPTDEVDVCGCEDCRGGEACDRHTPSEEEAATATVQPGAQVGDSVICPVSGEMFPIPAFSYSAEYEGQTYYLCRQGCLDAFLENPSQFAIQE